MTKHHVRRAPATRFTPRTEVLEDRSCPASIFVLGRAMFVLGDGAANTIFITDHGDGDVTATVNGTTREAQNINSIVVLAGGGNDTFDYVLDMPLATAKALLVDLGSGDDAATITAEMGVNSSVLGATVLGGDGADEISATLGGVAEGGYAAVALDGGRGDDAVSATFDGALNGTLALALSGGIGNDEVTGDLTIADGSTGRLAATALGGSGNDDMTLTVAGGDDLAFSIAVLDGGFGTDTCTATDNVDVFNCEVEEPPAS